jgi:serine/threonine protein kinase
MDPLSVFQHPKHWSGRGQYDIEFERKDTIEALKEGEFLGNGAFGDVYKVECQGVTLARKRIYTKRKMHRGSIRGGVGDEIEKLRGELEILKRLSHVHIITLVGSYRQSTTLGLLLFPAAVCDLGIYLGALDRKQQGEDIDHTIQAESPERFELTRSRLKRVYGCLANGIKYLHDNAIRHKDLKPQNILLHLDDSLFITDFGVSRDIMDADDSVTSGNEIGTLKYCAPEVARGDRRGRSSDIYSLGCTFLEMATVYCSLSLDEFTEFRRTQSDYMSHFFHNSHIKLRDWLKKLRTTERGKDEKQGIFSIFDLIEKMIAEQPEDRPSISAICSTLEFLDIGNLQKGVSDSYYGNCCRPRVIPVTQFDETERKLGMKRRQLDETKALLRLKEMEFSVYKGMKENQFALEREVREEDARQLRNEIWKQKEENGRLRDLLQSQELGKKYEKRVPNTPILQNNRTIHPIRARGNTHTAKKSVAEVLSSSKYWCEHG